MRNHVANKIRFSSVFFFEIREIVIFVNCNNFADYFTDDVINDKEQQKFYLWNNRIMAYWNNVGRK